MLRNQILERIEFWESDEAGPSGEMTDLGRVQEALEERREELKSLMDEKRIASGTAVNRAEYDDSAKTIVVTKFSGKLIRNMGRTVTGKRLLYPEEALYLMEGAALELVHNGVPLSLVQAYSLLIADDGLFWNQYRVYCHLTRAGYIVVRYRSSEGPETDSIPTRPNRNLFVAYDVHLADSGYSIAKKQRPDHRLVIMGADDDSISSDELRSLRSRLPDDVPLHAAVIDLTDVLYYSLDWVTVPEIASAEKT